MVLAFICPHCQNQSSAPDGSEGMIIHCPTCKNRVQLPAQSNQSQSNAPPVNITCPSCQGKLQVPRSQAGQKIFCHHCGQKLRVPTSVNRTILATASSGSESLSSLQVTPPVPDNLPVITLYQTEEMEEEEESKPVAIGTWFAVVSLICTAVSVVCIPLPIINWGACLVSVIGFAFGIVSLALASRQDSERATPVVAFLISTIAFVLIMTLTLMAAIDLYTILARF